MLRWPILVIIALSALAQDFRATISGQVSDRTGSAIPHASLSAIRLDNHEATRATTNSDGYYTRSYLTPGSSSIEVNAPGFKD